MEPMDLQNSVQPEVTVVVDLDDLHREDREEPGDVADGPDLVVHVDAADGALGRAVQLHDVGNLKPVIDTFIEKK